jgi:hypothetical protein
VCIDRILTRFPQASHEHVRLIVDARQRSHAQEERRWDLHTSEESELLVPNSVLETDSVHLLVDLEQSIIKDKEIPYPSVPEQGQAAPTCNVCGVSLQKQLSVLEWR